MEQVLRIGPGPDGVTVLFTDCQYAKEFAEELARDLVDAVNIHCDDGKQLHFRLSGKIEQVAQDT